MKINFLLLSFIISGLAWQAVAQSQPDKLFTKNHKKQNTQSVGLSKKSTQYLPQTILRNWWDNGDWTLYTDSTHNTYNAQGQLIEESTAYSKYLYTYDAGGNNTANLTLSWNEINETWDSAYKSSTTYDVHGNNVFYTAYNYNNGAWEISYSSRNINTYNNQNQLTEQTTEDWISDTTYKPTSRSVYTYNNQGQTSSYEFLAWDDNTQEFLKGNRYSDIQWYKWTGNPESSLYSSMLGYTWADSVYVLTNRQSSTYDNHDNETEYISEDYDGTNWTHTGGTNFLITYNSNGAMTQRIIQIFNQDSSSYTNATKERYSDFVSYTSVRNTTSNSTEVSVYPNPASGMVNIEINQVGSFETIAIYNLVGEKVLESNLTSNQNRIDVSLLPKGLYIYKLQSGTTGKLMIN